MREIVTVDSGDPVLRTRAEPVRRMGLEAREILDDMVDTMRGAAGVGLAAPQVGLTLRLIVVEVPVDPDDPEAQRQCHKLADPEIVWRSEEIEEGQEACLSIPGLYGDVPRHRSVRVRGIDPRGRRIEVAVSDFEARVFQHEIDHLDGVLFPDRVTSLERLYHLEEGEDGEVVRVPYRARNGRTIVPRPATVRST